jgi:NAD-dependent deacetylase
MNCLSDICRERAVRHIFVLTGAGISADSGIKTFRAEDGLWENHSIDDVCTPQGFARNPVLVQNFYNARRAELRGVEPNPAHLALARFADHFSGHLTLVTQNIDDLHERAGSTDVIHMHGTLLRVRCQASGQAFDFTGDVTNQTRCLCCHRKGTLRPDVVWFGEVPMHMALIESALADADLFVAIGTSGVVYPAAGFCQLARMAGTMTVELNLAPSAGAECFDICLSGRAVDTVPSFFVMA